MKVLAIEKAIPGVREDGFQPHLKAEAARVWELYQAGVLREIYFRGDWPGAVLMLETASLAEATSALDTLPLVSNGLIAFDVIPLTPYPGFARLFAA